MQNIFVRMSATGFSLFLVLVAPWWFVALSLLIFLFLFDHYYEAIVIALVFDLLYGTGTLYGDDTIISFYTSSFLFTVSYLVIFFLVDEVKKHLSFY